MGAVKRVDSSPWNKAERGPGLLPPPFTLRQLAYLVAAADAGTVVGAAERMHVSPSTMSDAITELEKLVGTQLCVRRRAQGLSLTAAGERAVSDGRALLQEATELYLALDSRPGEIAGPLAVGCFYTLAPTVLPAVLNEFGTQHPRLDIEFVEAPQGRLVQLLDSGRLDVAFVYDVYIPGRSPRVKLFERPPHILLSASHALAGAASVRLEDVIGDPFIMLDAPPSTEHALSVFTERGLSPRIRHRTANPDVVRALVGDGLGYGMLIQQEPVVFQGAASPVVTKEIQPAVTPLGIHLIWSPERRLSERVRALVKFAQSVTWPGG